MSPETLLGIALVVLFTAGAAAMISRTMPALIVLPVMGVAIAAAAWAITGDLTSHDVLEGVISEGAISLHKAMIVTFFGGALSFVMQRSGVAEQLVKQGAELVGADPLAVGVFSLLLVALLFSSLTGLGAVIMVSMIVLPMLSTVGLSPAAGAGIVLFGMSLGGVVNPANWVIYVETLGVPIEEVQRFALALFAIVTLGGVAMILVELFRGRLIRWDVRTSLILGGFLAAIAGVALWQGGSGASGPVASGTAGAGTVAGPSALLLWSQRLVLAGFGLLLLRIFVDLFRRASRWRHQVTRVRGWAYLIPVVPLVAILLFDVPILAAFTIGFVYAILATARPGSLALSVQCLIEGGASVMPAIILMIGIGILISAVKGPADWAATHGGSPWPVLSAIEPILTKLVPTSPLGYVLGFGLAAPLALYRGPLNVWGLGFGVATILLGAHSLPAAAIMAMLLSVGQIQGISDPTNTANVWIAHHQGVDVNALMLRTLPFVWGGVFISLVLSAAWFL